jgi:hypothetical protein
MAPTEYNGAVAKLLEIGSPEGWTKVEEWPDYPKEYGLTQADIPELIRLATDEDLYFENTEEEYPEAVMWGAIHALRALGQLKATQAIEPLIKVLNWEDDYALDTVFLTYGLIGSAAIPALSRTLQENSEDFSSYATTTTIQALERIAGNYPEARDEVIRVLLEQLKLYAKNDPTFNSFIVSSLTDLKAEQALPLIEEAFNEGKVDNSIIRWHSVQSDFDLISDAEYERIEKEFVAAHRPGSEPSDLKLRDFGISPGPNTNPAVKKQKEKAKAKRKMAKVSQKKNRKRK